MVYVDEVINCEYEAMTSEMIRDRLDLKLNLETAKKMVHQRETVEEQQHLLKRFETEMELA